jgi:hypothetical protein
MIDVCVINTKPIGGKVLESYRANAARPVKNDIEALEKMGVKILGEDLLRLAARRTSDGPGHRIRHDPGALGAVTVELALEARRAKSALLPRPARRKSA